MKKLLALLLGLACLPLSGFAAVTHFTETLPPAQTSGCIPVSNGYDWSLTCNSPAQPATFNGTTTVSQSMILTQQQSIQIGSMTTINPSAVFIVVSSSGNNVNPVNLANVIATPSIATATATSGQIVILISTSNGINGAVTFSSGVNSGLQLGSATRAMAYGKTLGLIYDSSSFMWKELFYGNN